MTGSCAACGSESLVAHLAVAGDSGPEGLVPTTDKFGTALSDVVRCERCGHMQLAQMPSATTLGEAYGDAASEAYVEQERGQRATARDLLDRLERHGAPGPIVDLGCWVGFLLDEARRRGWEPAVGVEPSRFASEYARKRLGLDVRTDDLLIADLPPRGFRAAVLGDVLEHLADPGHALDRVARLLAPGGALILTLPDAGSRVARAMGAQWWSVIPTHLHYFTRGSLRLLLDRHGYELRHLGTAPKAFTVSYYLGRIGGYSPPLARALVAGAAVTGLAERTWAPDFRDRMVAIATIP